jgi:hypothetical protein
MHVTGLFVHTIAFPWTETHITTLKDLDLWVCPEMVDICLDHRSINQFVSWSFLAISMHSKYSFLAFHICFCVTGLKGLIIFCVGLQNSEQNKKKVIHTIFSWITGFMLCIQASAFQLYGHNEGTAQSQKKIPTAIHKQSNTIHNGTRKFHWAQ